MNLSKEEKIEILHVLVKYLNEVTKVLSINTPINQSFVDTINEETESMLEQLNDEGVIIKKHENGKYYLYKYGDEYYQYIDYESDSDDSDSDNETENNWVNHYEAMQQELHNMESIIDNSNNNI